MPATSGRSAKTRDLKDTDIDAEKLDLLMRSYLDGGCRKKLRLRNEIVKSLMPLVDGIIRSRFKDLDRDELFQSAMLKVMNAIPKFDPKRGKALHFFFSCIVNACCDSVNGKRYCELEETQSSENIEEALAHREQEQIVASLCQSGPKMVTRLNGKEQKAFLCALHNLSKLVVGDGKILTMRSHTVEHMRRVFGLSPRQIQFVINYTILIARMAANGLDAGFIHRQAAFFSG